MHTFYFFWSSRLPSNNLLFLFEDESTSNNFNTLHIFIIITCQWIPHKVDRRLSMRHLLLPSRGEPYYKDSSGGSRWSLFCKCSFIKIMMYDDFFILYHARWLSSNHIDYHFSCPYMLIMEIPWATFFLSWWLLQPCRLLLQLSFQASMTMSYLFQL